MNTTNKFLSVILATGAAGVAVFALANSAFVAALPADVILGAGAALAILAFAAYDYSRRYLPLALPGRLLRPQLPAAVKACLGTSNACKDRAAA
ncbi:MAG: hypothetical protein PSV13_07965 [Lacunisphaera sp.]|nr:hypothetical protein [Lacunisphaera sp.]